MTFSIGLMNEGCSLCDRIRNARQDSTYLGRLNETHVFQSPFARRWPGALMLVYERHREEVSDIVSNGIPPVHSALLVAEKAIREVVNPVRMNVVKFGNVCPHLHWHLIPRFEGEKHLSKTSWELQLLQDDDLFSTDVLPRIHELLSRNLSVELRNAVLRLSSHPARFFYSAAMVFRPRNFELRSVYFEKPLSEIVLAVRQNPEGWESLLMRRGYDDFSWDHFGGCADAGEYPVDTLKREVREEAQWDVRDFCESSRHWRGSILRGFSFAVMPSEKSVYCENEHPAGCEEVGEVAWVPLSRIFSETEFSGVVRARTKALLDGFSDFECDDSLEFFV
jgi:diadenosine tetraphosphate (Ap4A) HIT family hydrolase/8-oxo-dGTP pyrophosphatase MutT (NUDIX family)